MPIYDDEKVFGTVFVESKETGNYPKCFMVVDCQAHKIRLYSTEAAFLQDPNTPLEEIGCQYITKISPVSTRPRIMNCFEMMTTTGAHYFSAHTPEEKEEWIDILKKSSLKHSKMLPPNQNKSTVSYQTTIVGGVVVRTPIQSMAQDAAVAESTERSSDETTLSLHDAATRNHIVKISFAVKLGAVRKSWKKRLFVLTSTSFGYYKTLEELEPIKSIPVADISQVIPTKDKENTFDVVTPSRTFCIAADSEADLNDWIKAFHSILNPAQAPQPSLQQQPHDCEGPTEITYI